MDNRYVTAAEFSRIAGVSRAAITQAAKEGRLYKDEKLKKFNIDHPVNSAFLENAISKKIDIDSENFSKSLEDKTLENITGGDASINELYKQKLIEEIERIKEAKIKLKIANAKEKKDLIPVDLMAVWMGYFATGIKYNFLTLGKRIGRDDIQLRDKIDAEVSKAIKKTIGLAEREVRKECQKIADKLKEVENENL